MKTLTRVGLLMTLILGSTIAAATERNGLSSTTPAPYVNVTVGGEIKPGVYGRIEVGNRPPPPVYSPQPVIIQQAPVVVLPGRAVVPVQPMYIYAPPGHRKKWAKHCARYNACGHPVYFVRVDERSHGKGKHGHDDDPRHGNRR